METKTNPYGLKRAFAAKGLNCCNYVRINGYRVPEETLFLFMSARDFQRSLKER